MSQIDVITVKAAAEEKMCTPQAIYLALDRKVLNEVRMGRTRLIVKDKRYRAYKVKEVGGRRHRQYLEKQHTERQ